MRKMRKGIPKATKEKVLKEFSHRCAKCGSDNPQLHHMDEDPSNNDPMNIIPLCPNCHLIDQHDPTKTIELCKLQLFRKYKDPSLLKPEFHPLYLRYVFFNSLEEFNDFDDINDRLSELIDFIKELEMGPFYAKKIDTITKEPAMGLATLIGDYASEQRRFQLIKEHNEEYRQKLIAVREEVAKLIVELLRYQPW
jgi:hypothetical protein